MGSIHRHYQKGRCPLTTFTLKLKIKDAILSSSSQENDRNHTKWNNMRDKLKRAFGFGFTVKDMWNDQLVTIPKNQNINVNAVLTLVVMERCLNNININESAMVLRRENETLRVKVVIQTNIDLPKIQQILNTISEVVIDGSTNVFTIDNTFVKLSFDESEQKFKPVMTISCDNMLSSFKQYIEKENETTADTSAIINKLKSTTLREKDIHILFDDVLD